MALMHTRLISQNPGHAYSSPLVHILERPASFPHYYSFPHQTVRTNLANISSVLLCQRESIYVIFSERYPPQGLRGIFCVVLPAIRQRGSISRRPQW